MVPRPVFFRSPEPLALDAALGLEDRLESPLQRAAMDLEDLGRAREVATAVADDVEDVIALGAREAARRRGRPRRVLAALEVREDRLNRDPRAALVLDLLEHDVR